MDMPMSSTGVRRSAPLNFGARPTSQPADIDGPLPARKEPARLVNVPPKKQATDVVVIGCGAGGGVMAKELGETGFFFFQAEDGIRDDPTTDYPTNRTDFEVRAKTV